MNPSISVAAGERSAEQQVMLNDIIDGLSRPEKMLPSKYFYDETGSRLFLRLVIGTANRNKTIQQEFGRRLAVDLNRNCSANDFTSAT